MDRAYVAFVVLYETLVTLFISSYLFNIFVEQWSRLFSFFDLTLRSYNQIVLEFLLFLDYLFFNKTSAGYWRIKGKVFVMFSLLLCYFMKNLTLFKS